MGAQYSQPDAHQEETDRFFKEKFANGVPEGLFEPVERGARLGEGKFGKVVKSKAKDSEYYIAIKICNMTQQSPRRSYKNETEILPLLNHVNTVHNHGFRQSGDDGQIYLSAAISDAWSLYVADVRLPVEVHLCYFRQLLHGLQYLESRLVVHCDIKLENILLYPYDALKISDFGNAVKLNAVDEELFQILGTPGYMAPEVISKEGYSFMADLWSATVTMVIMAQGRNPFSDKEDVVDDQMIIRCRPSFEDTLYRELKVLASEVFRAQMNRPDTFLVLQQLEKCRDPVPLF